MPQHRCCLIRLLLVVIIVTISWGRFSDLCTMRGQQVMMITIVVPGIIPGTFTGMFLILAPLLLATDLHFMNNNCLLRSYSVSGTGFLYMDWFSPHAGLWRSVRILNSYKREPRQGRCIRLIRAKISGPWLPYHWAQDSGKTGMLLITETGIHLSFWIIRLIIIKVASFDIAH